MNLEIPISKPANSVPNRVSTVVLNLFFEIDYQYINLIQYHYCI